MKVKVYLEQKDKEEIVNLDNNSNIKSLLEKLKINSGTVITANSNNELVTDNYVIKNNERIKIIPVISGG
ncbi:MoaD/ThiS family protein [Candidatus Woesearchaeota archaeon]|nr:MoaD/ThiS family protein [Candidatus Woesearchaeota archaeon]